MQLAEGIVFPGATLAGDGFELPGGEGMQTLLRVDGGAEAHGFDA